MENCSIGVLLVVFAMTLFIELNVINFELLRSKGLDEKRHR